MEDTARTLDAHARDMKAESTLREELVFTLKTFGIEDKRTLSNVYNLVMCLSRLGKLKEAEQMHNEMHVLNDKVLGRTHPDALCQRTE
jgi:pentatricopeptide repeat protein